MSFSTQDNDEVLSEMNVTPLVDVMLVLLVVFIVTTPMMTNAIKINLPKTDAVATVQKKDPVVVSVDQDGKFYLAKTEVAPELLEKSLPPDIAWYGYLSREAEAALPERHLGLLPAAEIDGLTQRIDRMADLLATTAAAQLPPPVAFAAVPPPCLPTLLRGKLSRVQGLILLAAYVGFCAIQFTM